MGGGGGVGGGRGRQIGGEIGSGPPPGKSQVAISFFRNWIPSEKQLVCLI